jgi:hypothetical protein
MAGSDETLGSPWSPSAKRLRNRMLGSLKIFHVTLYVMNLYGYVCVASPYPDTTSGEVDWTDCCADRVLSVTSQDLTSVFSILTDFRTWHRKFLTDGAAGENKKDPFPAAQVSLPGGDVKF